MKSNSALNTDMSPSMGPYGEYLIPVILFLSFVYHLNKKKISCGFKCLSYESEYILHCANNESHQQYHWYNGTYKFYISVTFQILFH